MAGPSCRCRSSCGKTHTACFPNPIQELHTETNIVVLSLVNLAILQLLPFLADCAGCATTPNAAVCISHKHTLPLQRSLHTPFFKTKIMHTLNHKAARFQLPQSPHSTRYRQAGSCYEAMQHAASTFTWLLRQPVFVPNSSAPLYPANARTHTAEEGPN
jgi:hypothetical protein